MNSARRLSNHSRRISAEAAGLVDLAENSVLLGAHACALQRHTGDFHLKALLGHVSGIALISGFDLRNCGQRLGLRDIQIHAVDRPSLARSIDRRALRGLHANLIKLEEQIRPTTDYAHGVLDWPLQRVLKDLKYQLSSTAKELLSWIDEGPTHERELTRAQGLYRDCELGESDLVRGSKQRHWLGDASFESRIIRAWYSSANAYLEITTVDIVSDLILRAFDETLHDLVRDLAFQLLDEVRHARLLAQYVDLMGHSLGCVPASTRTWELYESCGSLAEKIAAQHVVQESVGLDVSAHNIAKLRAVGDVVGSDIYRRITVDEKSHVALGIRWLARLGGSRSERVLNKAQKIARRIAPPPKISVVPELWAQAGFSQERINLEIAKRGSRNLPDLALPILTLG